MEQLVLEEYGVVEMDTAEICEVNGGWFIVAYYLACIAIGSGAGFYFGYHTR